MKQRKPPRQTIYCLAEVNGPAFFVGHTHNFEETKRSYYRLTYVGTDEGKCEYLRELKSKGIKWEMLTLQEVIPNTVIDDFVDYWIYRLLVEGNPIKNLKHITAFKLAAEDISTGIIRFNDLSEYLGSKI